MRREQAKRAATAERKAKAAEGLRKRREGKAKRINGLRIQLEKAKQTKAMGVQSRLPGSWSDSYHAKPVAIAWDQGQWSKLAALRKPLVLKVGATQTIKRIVSRGDPTLVDDCAAIEARISDMRPRSLFIGDVVTNRDRTKRIKYHLVIGTLPSWKPIARPLTAQQMATEVLIADWRARQQLAYLEALGVET